jgi:hypothetical protein
LALHDDPSVEQRESNMQNAIRPTEIVALRNRLDEILKTHHELELADDAPFVIYLTERMMRDIESCRKSCQRIKCRATWPSLN